MSQPELFYQTSFDLFSPSPEQLFSEVALLPTDTSEEAERAEEAGSNLPAGEQLEGYAVYIFTKDFPERQISRCYYIVYQPSLWDHYTVQRQWGLVGSPNQQFYTEHFRSPRSALARIRRLIDRRLRRGYRLSYAA